MVKPRKSKVFFVVVVWDFFVYSINEEVEFQLKS